MDCFISFSSLFILAINSFIYYIWLPIIPASKLDRDFSYSTLVKESYPETSTILSIKTDLKKAVSIPILETSAILSIKIDPEKAISILVPTNRTTSLVIESSYFIGRLLYLEGY